MEWVVEFIKIAGGIAGLASATFLIYDRLVRDRPIYAIHAKQGPPGNNPLFLRIHNALDEDIVVENWHIVPPLVGLSTDNSIRGMVGAVIGEMPRAILPPRGALNLVLVILGVATNRDSESIRISAEWSTTKRPWLFRRRVEIKTTVAKLKQWKEAHRPAKGA